MAHAWRCLPVRDGITQVNTRASRFPLFVRLLALTAISAALLAGLFAGAVRFWPESHWQPRLAELEETYGIAILLQDIDFPPSFRAQRARYRLTLPFERAAVLERLALDLSRYPPDFVRSNLRDIVILRSLELNGLPYGGTYDLRAGRIYLDAAWLGDDGTQPEAMGLHHEFSSVLMHRYPEVFRRDVWAGLNPDGFRYRFGTSSAANLRTDQLDLIGDPDIWEQGFVCGYGRLTLEDDINTYAQHLMAGRLHWRERAKRHPALAAKMDLLTNWYAAIGALPPDWNPIGDTPGGNLQESRLQSPSALPSTP